ncbi:unnamed protein product [Didymodactylos carnosus]|uniref:Disease resistance R13L4/SHOC-2-like LRR domain-containing protein n=1 Tax=Didymodactylos carnosus TaxID=1234261 RepID=A0A814QVF9_9BILA|nr:unnamed protein product [Didymodactylos carnosus]CAF1123319.1 unnamed protein product [Didymodactylos carnosus]CAF3738276.1 unnamed protein product [Didymodactylos carnosus]CAF3886848.1 unnamed protein product [Didymodactylos carnosus]
MFSTSTLPDADKRVYLSGRDLHTVNADVFSYPDINYLELSPTREACLDFKLGQLPRAIGRLTSLRFLILDTNDLDSLPEEISHLRYLQVLVVSNNRLNSIPETLGHIQSLESIHLANNRIKEFPLSFFHLINLSFLDLSSNKLKQIPDQIAHLSQLRTLLLYDNRLTSLPESIGILKMLTTLWLGKNRLKLLPRSLTKLRYLDWKNNYTSTVLDENPLVSPPIEVCRKGFIAIEKWYRLNSSTLMLNLEGVQTEEVESNRFTLRRDTPYFA